MPRKFGFGLPIVTGTALVLTLGTVGAAVAHRGSPLPSASDGSNAQRTTATEGRQPANPTTISLSGSTPAASVTRTVVTGLPSGIYQVSLRVTATLSQPGRFECVVVRADDGRPVLPPSASSSSSLVSLESSSDVDVAGPLQLRCATTAGTFVLGGPGNQGPGAITFAPEGTNSTTTPGGTSGAATSNHVH